MKTYTVNSVPDWVHMADVPPTDDDEGWNDHELLDDDSPWLGAVLLAVAAVLFLAIGIGIGRSLS